MIADRPCPSRDAVAALLLGTLSPEQEDDINLHLEGCPACAARAQEIERETDPLIDALRQPAPRSTALPFPSAPAPRLASAGAPEPFQLDGFRILGELGRGGMGVVYRAYQHRLNRLVAIKMILTGQLAGPEERARFMMEGALLAQLNHPNFVQVYEVGAVEISPGTMQPYLVLEYVEGGNLKAKFPGKPPSFAETARLVFVLARAMEAAHAQGIVHRDLKPANVLVARDGILKITDFGLAKELSASASLTPTGLAVGTPNYMAPEQAKGDRNIGPAADVYALGAILYEMLTGRPPFDAGTPVEILVQVLETPPKAMARLRAGVPRDLETICLKCLRKEPHARYTRAADMADDLQAWLEHRPIRARPVGWIERTMKWTRRHPLPAALLLFLVLSLVLGSAASTYFGLSALEQAEETKKALAQEEEARHASDRRAAELQLVAGQRLATDGETDRGLFFLARGWEKTPAQDADLQRVFRRNLEAWVGYLPRLRWYIDAKEAGHVVLAGNEVVYGINNAIVTHDAQTGLELGPRRQLAGQVVAAVSPNGARLCTQTFANQAYTLRVFERVTGKQLGVNIVDKRGGELWDEDHSSYYRLRFSPDSRLLLREFISSKQAECQLWDVTTGAAFGPPVVEGWSSVLVLHGKSDEWYWLLISEDRGIEVRNARHGAVLGGAEALPADVVRPPDLFPHVEVLQTLIGGKVRWWEAGPKAPPPSTWRLSETSAGHAVSHDGRFLTSVFGEQRQAWQDLATQQLCVPTAAVDAGSWGYAISPDARSCLYMRRGAYLKFIDFPRLAPAHVAGGASGESRFRAVAPAEMQFDGAVFSPDCKTSLIYGASQTHNKLYARLTSTLDNRPLGLPLTECDARAAISPSGKLIALATWDDTRKERPPLIVRVYDARTGEPRSRKWEVRYYIHTLAFSPDETRLAVGHVKGADLCDLAEGGESKKWMQPGPISRLLFSPDGRHLALCGRRGWKNTPGVRIWDVAAAQPVGPFVEMHDAPLVFAEEGDAFWTIELDSGRRRRWTFAAAAPVDEPTPLADWPTVPRGRDIWTLRADKKWLAVGSRHGAVWQWDLSTGQRFGPVAEFHQPCRDLQYSPDGRWLAVCGEDGEVGLFDPPTGKQLGPLLTQGVPLRGMTFTPDSRELLTVSRDGRCVRWPMGKPQSLTAAQWSLWLEAATGMQFGAETLLPLSVTAHQERLGQARILPMSLALPPQPPSQWHCGQALDAEHAGQFNSARWHLDRWIAAAPKDWLPHARRARVNALQGLTNDAATDLRRAAALDADGGLANWRRHQAAAASITGKSIPLLEGPQ